MLKSRSLRSTSPTAGSASNRSLRPSSARTGPPAATEHRGRPQPPPRLRARRRSALPSAPRDVDAPRDLHVLPMRAPTDDCDRNANDHRNAMPIALPPPPPARPRSSAHRGETRTRCTRRMAARRRSTSRAVAAAAGPWRAQRRSRRKRGPRAAREREVQRRAHDRNAAAAAQSASASSGGRAPRSRARRERRSTPVARASSSIRAVPLVDVAAIGSSYVSRRSGKSRVASAYEEITVTPSAIPPSTAGPSPRRRTKSHGERDRDVHEHPLDLADRRRRADRPQRRKCDPDTEGDHQRRECDAQATGSLDPIENE